MKNIGATYHRMMNKVFKEDIGETLEVYMDDVIIKSNKEELHEYYLAQIFQSVQKNNMRLNPEKWTYMVRFRKFLGFYWIEWGIEANSNKFDAVMQVSTPTSKK